MKNLFLDYNKYSQDYVFGEGRTLDTSKKNYLNRINPLEDLIKNIDSSRKSIIYVTSDVPSNLVSELEEKLKGTKVKVEPISH